MSYRGRSVYCSFCGERGHNRTGCPKRKQYIKENPNSWEAIKEQRKQQRRDEVKAKGGRKCSYCGKRGHTTRTCEVKKQDRVRLIEVLTKERTEGLKRLNEMGWGVGALFERRCVLSMNKMDTYFFGAFKHEHLGHIFSPFHDCRTIR